MSTLEEKSFRDKTDLPVTELVVVMVPFLGHAHVNQLHHLSRLISAHNIPVHLLSTSKQLHQFRSRQVEHPLINSLIHLHELPSPEFACPPPDPTIRFASHLQGSFESSLLLREPVAEYIKHLSTSSQRVEVVHDLLMAYVVQDVKEIPNAETYMFNPLSAFDTFWRSWEMMGRPFEVDDSELLNLLPSDEGIFTPEFMEFVNLQFKHIGFHVGELFDTSRTVEGEYMKYYERREMNKRDVKIWAVGPFIEASVNISHECLRWLDMQLPNSVIYVSFGTSTTFSDKQFEELAVGLERSQHRFIWVVRSADTGDGNEKIMDLPIGFEQRVKERGLVVRGWAPQMDILRHPATGGFLSHCGWNSSLESISMGVPIATWPMHSDQPRNAFLITHVLKTGIPMMDWAHRDELVTCVVVEDVIRRLMCSAEGDEIRKRAKELGEDTRKSVVEGGISRKETQSFVAYMKRII